MIARRALFAGLGIIALANGVALVGVRYNRLGEPDATLTLSERELQLPYSSESSEENSGLTVSILACASGASGQRTVAMGSCYDRSPEWLDSAKLSSLGFDVGYDPRQAATRRHYERQLSRPVLLVLELDGVAYVAVAGTARGSAARIDSLTMASRLYLVDAGTDREALRSRYPDRGKYAIVNGTVTPNVITHNGPVRLRGSIQNLDVLRINVPLQFRSLLDSLPRSSRSRAAQGRRSPIDVTIAFGQRLEPWILQARRRP